MNKKTLFTGFLLLCLLLFSCETFGSDTAANVDYLLGIEKDIILEMNKAFTQTGVGYGTHPQFRTSCTITYANGYTSN